jgi:hypothetical protein
VRIQSLPTPWKTILLFCGKCTHKLDGGYGLEDKDTIKAALRRKLAKKGLRRQVSIIETRCMDVCPTKAVTAFNPARSDRILSVPKRTSAHQGVKFARRNTGLTRLLRASPP